MSNSFGDVFHAVGSKLLADRPLMVRRFAVPTVLVVGIFGAVVTTCVVPVGSGATPGAIVTPSPTPAAAVFTPSTEVTTAPSADPSATGRASVEGVSVSARQVAIPRERRFLVTGFHRLLVLDLAARTATEFGRVNVDPTRQAPGSPQVTLSESADGRLVLLTVIPPERPGVVFLIRPERGEIHEVFRGTITGTAQLAPDGRTFALARVSSDPAIQGVWVGTRDAGLPTRLVADSPGRVGSPPLPLQLSPDGSALAVNVIAGPGQSRVALVRTGGAESSFDPGAGRLVGGDVREVGAGRAIDGLRTGGPLLVASSRDAFGGDSVLYRTAPDGTARRDVYRPGADTIVSQALWRPQRGGLAVVQHSFIFPPGSKLQVLVLDDAGTVVTRAEHAFIVDLWWSSDGTRLFAALGGDDSTGRVIDLISGEGILAFCQRGGDRPPCT